MGFFATRRSSDFGLKLLCQCQCQQQTCHSCGLGGGQIFRCAALGTARRQKIAFGEIRYASLHMLQGMQKHQTLCHAVQLCPSALIHKGGKRAQQCDLLRGMHPKKAGETIVTVHADPTDHYAEGAVDVKVIVKERDDIEEKITLQYEAGDGGSIAAVDAATGKILENGAKIKPNAEVQFTASPNSGYSVKNWVVNGEVYKENGIVYTGMELKRAITASSDSVKVEFVKDEPAFVKGDVNLSGKVEIGDVREALRSICKKTELTALQKQAADVNENGNVDIEDLRKILRFVCGKIDQLNMEESGASK